MLADESSSSTEKLFFLSPILILEFYGRQGQPLLIMFVLYRSLLCLCYTFH